MGIFRNERLPARWLRLLPAVPTAAALLLLANSARAQECESDVDCAAGYYCGWAGISDSVNTVGSVGSGSVGGGPNPFCGDGTCDSDETEASCPQDCSENRTCQVAYQLCNEDDECAPGFYCDDEGGGVSTTGLTAGTNYDGMCAVIGTTSGSGGGSATDGGAGAPTEETTGSAGEASSSGDESSSGNDSSSGDSFGATFGGIGTATNGGPVSGSDGDGSGSGGASGGNGNGSGHGGQGNGHGNGNGHGQGNGHGHGNGHGQGNGHGPWPQGWPGHGYGCSVGGVGAPGGGLFMTALAAFGAVFARRRRS